MNTRSIAVVLISLTLAGVLCAQISHTISATTAGQSSIGNTQSGSEMTQHGFWHSVLALSQNSSISGMKFNDFNGNGIKDVGEPGLEEWTMTLEGGAQGGALQFDGSSDVIVPNQPALSFLSTDPITVEAWVFRTGNAGVMHILGKRSGCNGNSGQNYQLAFDGDGIGFGGDKDNGNTATTGVIPPLNQWMHIAGTFDGTTLRVFVDGIPAGSVNGTLGSPNGNDVKIAASGDCGGNWVGIIDEVRIWNIARTQPQIQQTMNMRLTGNESGLVGYWPFDEGTGNTTADHSVSGDTGTFEGNPQWDSSSVGTGRTTVTDQSGNYTFTDIPSGDYMICEQNQARWMQTFPTPPCYSLTLLPATDTSGFDFGNQYMPPSSISGMKFNDIDSNGVRNPGDSGLAGWTFTLGGGMLSKVLQFDGVDDHVDVGPVFSSVSADFTMELWVNPNHTRATTPEQNSGDYGGTGQRYAIFPMHGAAGGYGDGHAGAGISVGTNGISVFEHTAFYLPSPLVYDAPVIGWNHIALVYQNNQPSLYLNGTLVHTGMMSTYIVHPSADISGIYGYFGGMIDEVRVWNFARTQSEIQSTMNTHLTGSETGLVGYWPFDEGAGTTTSDQSGHNNTGTLANGPVWITSSLGGSFSAVTDANGNYVFHDLFPGTYTLCEQYQTGWRQTFPTPLCYTIVLPAGSDTTGFDFGNHHLEIPCFTVSEGWNLLSLPARTDDSRVSILFPGAVSKAFAYNGTYVIVDSLKNGIGYWLKFGSPEEVCLEGVSACTDTVKLVTGWNIIGGPTCVVSLDSIIQIPDGIITSNYFGFDGATYVVADSLRPFNGYWVRAGQEGELIIKGIDGPLQKPIAH